MENTKTNYPKSSNNSRGKIIAIIIGAVILVGGLTAGGIYLATHQQPTTIISADASGSSTKLSDGENKIKAGGTYTFTGSTSNGKIEIDTTEDVKIILDNVSIANPSGAAIKSKGAGKLTIELIGENALTTTDKTADDPSSAISGDADLEITGTGSATIKANGKGIKADGTITLGSATLNINTTDDAVHSNSNITISSGSYTINTGDDGIHADKNLIIKSGKITIEKSHEGLESNILEISGGEISIVADDDGVNAQNSDGSTRIGISGDGTLNISGGKLYVNSGGDGLDSNGSIEISGGEIFVDGPTNNGNGAIDCDSDINITGGTLVAVGSSGMAQNATSATQPSVLMNLSSSYKGELSFGGITFAPAKSYQSVLISSSSLKIGESYSLVIDGATVQSVTISQNITGQGTGMMGGGMTGGNPMGGQQPSAQPGGQTRR